MSLGLAPALSQPSIPIGQRFADRMWIVFLNEVQSLSDMHCLKIEQILLEALNVCGLNQLAGRCVEQELRDAGRLEPFLIAGNNFMDVGGFAGYRNLVWPLPNGHT